MRTLLRAVFISAVLVYSLRVHGFAADTILDKDKKRLDKYKEVIKEHQAELKVLKGEEDSVFDKLKHIQTLVDNRQAELRAVKVKEGELTTRLVESESSIAELTVKTDKQRSQLKRRAVTLYRLSDMLYLKILFSSSSYVDISKRYKYLKIILNQDSDLIAEYINNQEELHEKRKTLKKEKEKLDEIIKKVKNKEEEVLAEKNSKIILLLKVKREKDYYLKAIKELDESAKKLDKLIKRLQRDTAESSSDYAENFKEFKKILEPPVKGGIISYFGREYVSRLDSYLFNNGIKFSAQMDQDVRAVFNGNVIYSDWFRGYGKLIILSHNKGYYTIYSHLSKLLKSAGTSVKRGDMIAMSGDTGSLTGACLYFEIRYKGRSVDPLDWLEPTVKREEVHKTN